jgi:hypothetical protein
MTGVMTTLKTGHTGHLISEQVNDLALAFVTPLGAENYNVLSHGLFVVTVGGLKGFNDPTAGLANQPAVTT